MTGGGPAGPVPSPTHWARVQLMQGASSAGMWDLSSQLPEARVTVGSGPEAGWNVQAPDVMPLHFELYWDGKSLWVGPPVAGTLTADGEPVVSWRQLAGRTRLEFGRAAMLVEASQAIEVEPSLVTAPLTPAPADFVEDEATAIFEEQAFAFGASMEPSMEPPTAPLEPDATRMLEPDGPGAIPRPGLGGAVGAVGVGLGLGSGAGPVAPPPDLRTQILDTEALGVRPSTPPPGPPPPGPPPPPGSPPMPGPPGPVVPGSGAGPAGDSRPTLASSDQSTDVLSFRESAPPPREIVGPGGAKFALPPVDDGKPAARADGGPKGLKDVPTRTWILLGVTLTVAVLAIVMGSWKKRQREEALAAEAAAQQQAQTQQAQAHADLLREQIRADAERLQRERERLVALVEEDVTQAVQEARQRVLEGLPRDATEEQTEEALREASRLAVEKLAADATVANDLRRALGLYLRLQRDYPRPEYDVIVEALRAKLECRRGVRRDGTSCT